MLLNISNNIISSYILSFYFRIISKENFKSNANGCINNNINRYIIVSRIT